MTKLVFGTFSNREEANKTIMELEDGGVPLRDFSVIGQGEVIEETESNVTAEEVTTSGAVAGGAVGGLAGLIAGAAATAGMFVAGPLAILTGLGWITLTTVSGGAGGAVAGGLVGALVSLDIPKETAEQQDLVIKAGGVLLGVEDNEVSEQEVRECFEKHNAEHIVVIDHASLPTRLAAGLP